MKKSIITKEDMRTTKREIIIALNEIIVARIYIGKPLFPDPVLLKGPLKFISFDTEIPRFIRDKLNLVRECTGELPLPDPDLIMIGGMQTENSRQRFHNEERARIMRMYADEFERIFPMKGWKPVKEGKHGTA